MHAAFTRFCASTESPKYFVLFHLISSALFTSKINDNLLAKHTAEMKAVKKSLYVIKTHVHFLKNLH